MIALEKQQYHKALKALDQVSINTLFVQDVLEERITGEVYADQQAHPSTFYVLHPYGMSLLFGSCNNQAFNQAFKAYSLNSTKARNGFEWMQAYPNDWHQTLTELYDNHLIRQADNSENLCSGIVELNTRVNFKFNPAKYQVIKENLAPLDGIFVKTAGKEFDAMTGSVIPSSFWRDQQDFLRHGAGISYYQDGKLACTAYAAFLVDNKLEFGIETLPAFRGKGIAKQTCSRLIDYCLAHDLEPVWACRLENVASFQLAQKLGFEPTTLHPYYRLSE